MRYEKYAQNSVLNHFIEWPKNNAFIGTKTLFMQ